MENDTAALQGPGAGQRQDLMPKPDMDRATTIVSTDTVCAPPERPVFSQE